MTDDLRADMESLRALSHRLNGVTDQATAAIKAAEEFLASLSIGVPALSTHFKEERAADPEDEESKDDKTFWYLAYGRSYFSNGKFAIHVAKNTERPSGYNGGWDTLSEDPVQWSSLTRADKLRAFTLLPELLRNIVQESTKLADSAEETQSIVAEMMEALRSAGGASEGHDSDGLTFAEMQGKELIRRDAELGRSNERAGERVAEIQAEKQGVANVPVRRRRS